MNLHRNIVIEASAGTGKTYTLVQTIMQALFQKNLPMESLVALTFTKKAAGEMKERIAAELQKIDHAAKMEEAWREWGQSLDVLQKRAREALETIDRAAIGTIHSYAFSLLKRFPLEAGISPDAEVDDKNIRIDDLFEVECPVWLRQNLKHQTSNMKDIEEKWLKVLKKTSLGKIRELARRLCDFDIPLEALPLSDEHLKENLEPFYQEIRKLLIGKPDQVKSTRIAVACEEVLGRNIIGPPPVTAGDDVKSVLEETPTATKDWPDDEIRKLKVIRAIALNLLAGGDGTLALLTDLLKPFITHFRRRLIAEGYLSNNALLVLARDLVAKEIKVRETLKRQIRIIFVDEFQDTDPLQGELLLFLSELPGTNAKSWDQVRLEPGKLFIVGDPKQSIYLFRGADIGAYGRITEMVMHQGGERHVLAESYRSHERIIHAVNAAFAPLILETPLSPAYQALVARRTSEDAERHLVELRLACSTEQQSSDSALNKEAEDAASWIASAIAAKRWTYKDVALIFRSTPAMTPFIEKLRAQNIPFVVEGERYFYRTPEVTDVLNLLRALEDSSNRIALVGFLRSALGGFTDAELALLQQKNGLRMDKPLPKEFSGAGHRGSWELLQNLRRRVSREPLKRVLHHIYEDTFLLELAARSYHRDQTIANLNKLRRLMESFAEEGETSLRGLLTKIDRFIEDDRLEGESPLADESYDAVRLLTIHKAKGLEFPVVWLPGLHRNAGGNPDSTQVKARYDWSSGRLGISLGGQARNIGDFILKNEMDAREEAEDVRVLYVAMTRARDHLILSGGVCSSGRSKQPASGSFLAQLAGAWKLDLETLSDGELQLGDGILTVRRIATKADVTPRASLSESEWLKTFHPAEIAATWKTREQRYTQMMSSARVVTPSAMEREQPGAHKNVLPPTVSSETPTRLGTLVHKFLEAWDFHEEKCAMPLALRHVANSYFASEGLLKEPFPDPKLAIQRTKNPAELTVIVDEAQRLLADFIGSEEYDEIKGSTILGREVPFFYGSTPLVRGVMDILYRTAEGRLVVGDYKTDKIQDPTHYEAQGQIYRKAVSQILGEEAEFRLIYLRNDTSKRELTQI
jgi:ATP-dependent helicase/nuclease subunit A